MKSHECLSALWMARADLLAEELHQRSLIGGQTGWAKGLDDEGAFDALSALYDALETALYKSGDPDGKLAKVAFDHSMLYSSALLFDLALTLTSELEEHRVLPNHAPGGAGWLEAAISASPITEAGHRLFRRVREALDAKAGPIS